MPQVEVKVLGISGTPVKGGNCDTLVQEALKAAAEIEGVTTEFITLAEKKIAMCRVCQYCIEHRSRCRYKDDANSVLEAMEQADGLILGGPTWVLTLAPPLVNLFSRARHIAFFTHSLKDKAGGAITLGWLGIGLENALHAIEQIMIGFQILPVGRASAKSSAAAFGQRPAYLEHGVLDDLAGVVWTRRVGRRVAEVARMIRYAKDNGIVLPPRKREKVFVEGVWRDKVEAAS